MKAVDLMENVDIIIWIPEEANMIAFYIIAVTSVIFCAGHLLVQVAFRFTDQGLMLSTVWFDHSDLNRSLNGFFLSSAFSIMLVLAVEAWVPQERWLYFLSLYGPGTCGTVIDILLTARRAIRSERDTPNSRHKLSQLL